MHVFGKNQYEVNFWLILFYSFMFSEENVSGVCVCNTQHHSSKMVAKGQKKIVMNK